MKITSVHLIGLLVESTYDGSQHTAHALGPFHGCYCSVAPKGREELNVITYKESDL